MSHPQITIIGRRWFQKTYGNTYHSVSVYVDGKLIGREPYHYGYGDQYIQTAFKLLQNAKIYPETNERLPSGIDKDFHDFLQDKVNNHQYFNIECIDVTRKRDL